MSNATEIMGWIPEPESHTNLNTTFPFGTMTLQHQLIRYLLRDNK